MKTRPSPNFKRTLTPAPEPTQAPAAPDPESLAEARARKAAERAAIEAELKTIGKRFRQLYLERSGKRLRK